jgi:predicted nucleic acid-binding protein
LDSSVYIGHWEHGLYAPVLEQVRHGFIVRHSAVVLSELYRGAKTPRALQLVEDLYRFSKICWTPDSDDWRTAGKLLGQLTSKHGWQAGKIRDLQNDTLIALTARKHGATVVTVNRRDFEAIHSLVRFSAIYV